MFKECHPTSAPPITGEGQEWGDCYASGRQIIPNEPIIVICSKSNFYRLWLPKSIEIGLDVVNAYQPKGVHLPVH